MRALTLTLFLTLIPLIAAALVLGAALNYASVRVTYLELAGDRLSVVARRIAADAQTALSLGLPLRGQDALDRTLTREGEADAMLGDIFVLDANNRVLFSSNPSLLGGLAPSEPGALLREAAIMSAFGTTEGRVIVTADEARIHGVLSNVIRAIGGVAAAVIAVGAVAVALALFLVWRRLSAALGPAGSTGGAVPKPFLKALQGVDAALDAAEAQIAKGATP